MADINLSKCTGFDWDEGNFDKNWSKHRVTPFECEQVFFNQPLIVDSDETPSEKEPRFLLLGQTDMSRRLFLVFTVRKHLIRVISARDMSRKEKEVYASHEN